MFTRWPDTFRSAPPTWKDWNHHFRTVLGFGSEEQLLPEPVTMGIACSGVAEQVAGTTYIHHKYSCDHAPASQAFIRANFSPPHLISDIRYFLEPTSYCQICDGECKEHLTPRGYVCCRLPLQAVHRPQHEEVARAQYHGRSTGSSFPSVQLTV